LSRETDAVYSQERAAIRRQIRKVIGAAPKKPQFSDLTDFEIAKSAYDQKFSLALERWRLEKTLRDPRSEPGSMRRSRKRIAEIDEQLAVTKEARMDAEKPITDAELARALDPIYERIDASDLADVQREVLTIFAKMARAKKSGQPCDDTQFLERLSEIYSATPFYSLFRYKPDERLEPEELKRKRLNQLFDSQGI
jgi:hypothetical protein